MSRVPHGILLRLEGPTVDFVLGRIFGRAVEHATKEVYKMNPLDDNLTVLTAKSGVAKRICGLM
jgi:hypothetical protein